MTYVEAHNAVLDVVCELVLGIDAEKLTVEHRKAVRSAHRGLIARVAHELANHGEWWRVVAGPQ